VLATAHTRYLWLLVMIAGLGFVAAADVSRAEEPASSDGVKLEALKYDAFQARLAQAKAKNFKYTLVDAWATTCGPCKENFPHLVAMHKRFADKGLQVISLSLDDTTDAKALESARKFLSEKKATFLNVVLDEDFGVGFDKLNINAIPAVFLYGPDGKEIKRFTMDDPNNQFTYDEVEKAVTALLEGKAAQNK
jgi:thiol-disulfide isomerase/thioredoxin